MITYQRVHDLLDYDPETGWFAYKYSPNNRVKKGTEAGSLQHGYLTVMIDGKNYRLHRLAFLLMEGKLPDCQIDHINGNRSDNRWCNLRKVTHEQNCWNKKAKGVCFHKRAGKYVAYSDHLKKREHLGCFDTFEEAHAVASARRAELKGEYYRP